MPHGAPSSSITSKWPYDVFLSYNEGDTFNFTDVLHNSLSQKGLSVYVREGIMRHGYSTSKISKAIHKSRITIILFTKNYASSESCLQELVQILECFKEQGRSIYPVFYDVDRLEVQNQTGSYAKALDRLEKRLTDRRHHVEEWRQALSQAAHLPGYYYLCKTTDIHEGVRSIIERVTAWMNKKEEEEEEGHDATIHGTTDLSFWKKKERVGSYDVFLSYREAKQFDFPSLLCDSLRQEGLSVCHVSISSSFILKKQATCKPSKALPESRIAIIVFSKNYAASANRLEELVQILKCFKGEGRLIYPVFYDVDPSEVQNQTGSYGEALAQLEKKFKGKRDQVEECRMALTQVAGLSDYHHVLPGIMNEDECIGAIVERATAWMNEKEKFWVWDKGEEIGSGAHGNVYVAHHWKTRAICGAIKELNNYKTDDAYEYIRKEIKFLSELKKHPNIVEYYGHKEEEKLISIYMEYIQPGSLKLYIEESGGGKLNEPFIQNFTAQILFGLVHLHSNRQVHRDLKPDNLLIDSKNIVKLVDFGLAKLLAESLGYHSVSGTLRYAAPEVIHKKNYQTSREALAADIWSLGCVIIVMFSGLPRDSTDLHRCIPEELCVEGKNFLKLCFKRKPAERPSAEELLKHPFVKVQVDALMEESARIDGV